MADANLPPVDDTSDEEIDQPLAVDGHQPNNAPQHHRAIVNSVQIKIPPFWKQDPDLWFRQIEAQFSTAGIRADLSKYNQIVGKLDSDILTSVSDIVKNPPDHNKYQTLKNRLTKEFTESDKQKLKTLFSDLTLVNTKPSELLRKMREKTCNKVGEELLQELWSNRLPQQVQSILACSNEPLTQQVLMADKIFETLDNTSIQAIAQRPSQFESDLTKQFCQLEDKIDSLQQIINKSTSRNRSPWRSRSSSGSRDHNNQQNNTHCWYHKLYKSKARKCDGGSCTFNKDQKTNSKN